MKGLIQKIIKIKQFFLTFIHSNNTTQHQKQQSTQMEIEESSAIAGSAAAAASTTTGSSGSLVPTNEDPYFYVATIYKGTVVTHSVVGHFLAQDKNALIVS